MENQKVRAIGYACVAGLLVFGARYCDKPRTIAHSESQKDSTPPAFILKSDEKQKIIIDADSRRVTVVTPEKIQTFSGVRHTTVVQKVDGTLSVSSKDYGLCFEPGIGVMVSDRTGPSIDFQFAYWGRAGAIFGARVWPSPSGLLAASYELSGLGLHNTSLYVGIDHRRDLAFGVRVRL